MMLHDVIRILVRYRKIQTQNICFMMYFLINSKYQISYRCFISSKHSKRRNFSNIRSHVIQFDFTLYFKSIRVSNFDSFVFAIFASIHDLTLKKFVRKFQTTYCWKNRIVKKIISLKKFVLKKFARKFQIEFVKIQNKWHKRLLWKNIKNTIFANVLQSKFNWYNLTKTKLMRFCWN